MKRFNSALSVAVFVVGDLMAVAGSYILGYLVRILLWHGAGTAVTDALPLGMLLGKAYLLIAYPFVFAYEGLYTKRLTGWEETRRCFRGMFVATAVVTILLFMVRFWIVSRIVVLLALVFGILAVPLVRALLKRLLVASGVRRQSLTLVGGGEPGRLFERELARNRAMGYAVVERLDRQAPDESVETLLNRAQAEDGSLLVVVSDSFNAEEMKAIFKHAECTFADLLVVPNAALLQSSAAEIEQVGSLLVMKYRYNLLRPLNTFTKRAFELAVSGLLTVLVAPLFGGLSFLVHASSPGPVFFRQPRIGRDRRLFSCLKFRTMYQDAEQRLDELLHANPAVRQEWERYARITDDPRVTPVGRFLRRFSIDELPQLWNVLRGEMALVGPRPYLPSESDKVGEYLDTIVRVRPGMTGLWQVSGRTALPFAERTILDEYYIKNWSLWMDFSIILRTIRAVLSGRGAY
jgi:undecaprenyl-phosphate galactose phosphotransferase